MATKTKNNTYLNPSVIVLALAFFLASISFLNNKAKNFESISSKKESSQLSYRESLAQSLDLRVSSKAIYPGGNIQRINDLGTLNDTHKYIIRFPVPNSGLKEYALMSLPTTSPPKGGYPLIILCHGYINPALYSTTSFYVSDMEYYSQHGFAVIKPDFRGQGLSVKSGRAEGAYFSMAYNIDLMNLISSAKRLNYIDKNNISLWGHSMGGYLALRASVMSPDVKNVIILSGVVGRPSDIYSTFIAPSDLSNPIAEAIRQKILLKRGSSLVNPSYWHNVSPLSFLDNSQAYYQIYVGLQDHTVPPAFSTSLDEVLTKDSIKHVTRVFPEADHGLVGERPVVWADSLKYLRTTEN